MFFNTTSMYNYVIMYIVCTFTFCHNLLYDVLVQLRYWVYTKTKSFVSVETLVCYKCSYSLDFSFNSIWWKPYFKSSLVNVVLPFKLCKMSSTVGIGWHSLSMVLFAFLISMHSLISPEGLGIMTTDRKSTRLNSSHANISYAVFCLKKKSKSTKLSSPILQMLPPIFAPLVTHFSTVSRSS